MKPQARRAHPLRLATLLLGIGIGAGCAAAATPEASAPTTGATIEPMGATTVPPSTTAPAPNGSTTSSTVEATVPIPEDPPSDAVTDIVATLTIEEKVGQMLMPVLAGTSAARATSAESASNEANAGTSTIAEAVTALDLGGVLYLGPNIVNAEQVAGLSADIQVAAVADTGIGALIAVDQEGGRVARIADGVPVVPAARTLAEDPDRAADLAARTAVGLRAQGVNTAFAPVADLTAGDEGAIGDRSYSADPGVAATLVTAVVEGLESSGVAASAKHWPGHGDTSIDSHESLPTVAATREVWTDRELVPFAAAIAADVDMIMVGHLAFPELDPSGTPASLSPALVADLLREQLDYDGVVITDALDMGALAPWSDELAVRAVLAGNDILLAPTSVAAARSDVLAAVADGRIPEERLNASVARILRLKQRLGLPVPGA